MRFEALDAWLEFALVQIALAVAVDQTADALAQLGDLLVQCGTVGRRGRMRGDLQAALVFVHEALGRLEQLADLLPNGLLEAIGAYLRVAAHPLTAEAVGIGPDAAIVGVVTAMTLLRARWLMALP